MGPNRRFVLLAVLMAIVIGVFVVRGAYQTRRLERSTASRLKAGESMASIEDTKGHEHASRVWQSLPYTKIEASPAFDAEWRKLRVDYQTSVTREQHARMLADAQRLLFTLASPNPSEAYAEYVSAHRPVSCTISTSELSRWAWEVGLHNETTPLPIITAVVRRTAPEQQIETISLPASSITYREHSTGGEPYQPLRSMNTADNTVRLRMFHRLFKYPDEFATHYDRGEKVRIAELDLYLAAPKRGNKVTGGPYKLRLWWSAKNNEWLPLELASGSDDKDVNLFLP